MKRSVVVGCQGQDGRLLTEQLAHSQSSVFGIGRQGCEATGQAAFDFLDRFQSIDILDTSLVDQFVEQYQPNQLYYLPAYHQSAEAQRSNLSELFDRSHAIHVRALFNFLDAIRRCKIACRVFYAASSHCFGNPVTDSIDETTPLNPICIYGMTKTTGVHLCRFFREQHSIFASAGFLFNHESIHRRSDFLTKKIIRTALAIQSRQSSELVLGDLSASVDWGYAGDYTQAMQAILEAEVSSDFVIASGTRRTVREFVGLVFDILGMRWQDHVRESPTVGLFRRNPLIGNPAKLKQATGWKPQKTFESMVREMVHHETTKQMIDA
jgi:GDPmannose 4,6-dehydratase